MIDEQEKTPVIFIILDDEHLSQLISNVHQVKERGATTIVVTDLADIGQHIDRVKLDFVIQLAPSRSVLSALQAVTPLQMLVYLTAKARGINPDQQMFEAIDFN